MEPLNPIAAVLRALRQWRPEVTTTTLALIASLFSTLACNGSLWHKLQLLPAASPLAGWGFLAAMAVLVAALQFILFLLLLNRWTAKPLLTVMAFLTGASVYFMHRFDI